MSLDLVFEILCEQMPSKMMDIALEYLKTSICSGFSKFAIESRNSRTLVSANRICFIAEGLEQGNSTENKEIKGPRVSSSQESIAGFLRKVGKSEVRELEVRSIGGVEFYYSVRESVGVNNLNEKVCEILQDAVDNFPLHKRMKWGCGIGEWVRPVLNVACVLGGEVVPVTVAGSKANNITYGNIRFAKTPHTINGVDGYLSFLSENMVMLDHEERRRSILRQLNEQIAGTLLKYDVHDKIIEELNGMLEYPKVLLGSVDEKFMSLPREVIACVLTKHQRCLAIYDSSGRIVKFASVASVINERVIKIHEMVLRARLSDAMFLIEKDKQYGLDRYREQLANIVFKRDLGSVLDKVNRISALAKYASVWVPRAHMLEVERASLLSKADLASLMVKEFPELQGKMGRYYAQHAGEESAVCDALEEHYLPSSQQDRCPSSPVGIALSIADKVDTLVGLMATERISGSRDPFALRRTAIALLRVIKENCISIPLDLMVSKSVSFYLCDAKKNKDLKSVFRSVDVDCITSLILDFCYERLKIILREEGLDRDIVNIVVGEFHDILLVKKKAVILSEYLKTEDGKNILAAYRRIRNVLLKGSSVPVKEKRIWYKWCSEKLCIESCEIELYRKAKHCDGVISSVLKAHSFKEAMDCLANMSSVVNDFLDKVRVHDDGSIETRKNRVNLSLWVVSLYNSVIDFSKIPKES
ncbi:glycine--tRNA ligase subunit beta [Anaplasma phagocytophilum]|uniref:glycine--tRNA ligase subunit beta n=1 Tax=Anaplasma phagocytophilum TaxID=948 RepID=UPI0007E0563A|nr:glycine--tRNA ligase subunit beta [Anaplasma phagocytophilum]SBO32382.1 Glycine--tRNA ligase beta subunit [Anaplasma phagocytophilum]SBO32672.1 Glycine--tRNA ligase beta subunit [Anaplasma phagocytophilum]SBO32971.1 Glycine--tRNA ligase beta subunit [Anaplasma phagocytophilum]SCV64296.1 Glycine--tRNA ligase beta subunit [Anaplasma phagocytophilum]